MIRAKTATGSRRRRVLVGVLAGVGITYLLLLPRLRQMQADTAKLEREIAARESSNSKQSPALAGSQGEAGSAVSTGHAAAALDPSALREAQEFGAAGRLGDAEARLRATLKGRPLNLDEELFLADIFHRQRDYYRAIQGYRAILSESPGDPRATAALGSLYIALGWTQDAMDILADAVQKNPSNLPLKVALAMANLQHADDGKAETQLRAVKSAAPDQPALWGPLLPLLTHAHRYPEAITIGRDLASRMPDNASVLMELARALLESGNVQEATEMYRRVIAQNDKNAGAHFGLARCYAKIGQREEAIREDEAAIQRQPSLTPARLQLGQLYLQTGRESDGRRLIAAAKADVEKGKRASRVGYLLSNRTHDADSHWQMANAYKERGDLPRQLVELQRTLELNPKHQHAHDLLTKARAQLTTKDGRP